MIFEQMRQQDRLLDQMIILEALFQLGSEKQELSYRLRLRAAHFLGDDLADRKVVASTVNKAYSLRSAIAHGATESKVKNAADIQQAMDELVPRLLRKYCREVAAGDIDGLQKRICLEMDSRVLERANDR